jgi:2-amino-4-hydroxy-6-hydroxymethyldihydropteridine diphosphokinase
MLNRAYLSLGSNIEPVANLTQAVRSLARVTKLVAVSSVWETKPIGLIDQPRFLNAAVVVRTGLSAQRLKRDILDGIEWDLGRTRQSDKNAARPIDIDVMLFNRDIFQLGTRFIPDSEIMERAFVAIPLAEIAPDYLHPLTGQTLAEIARGFAPKEEEMFLLRDVSTALSIAGVAIGREHALRRSLP